MTVKIFIPAFMDLFVFTCMLQIFKFQSFACTKDEIEMKEEQ